MDKVKSGLTILGIALLIGGLGYGIGRYTSPTKVITEIKEVVKEVKVENKNIDTKTTTVKKPDGTVATVTETKDRSTIVDNRTDIKDTKKEVDYSKSNWHLKGLVGTDFDGVTPIYGASVERRIIGPVFLGVQGQTNHTLSLSVGMEF